MLILHELFKLLYVYHLDNIWKSVNIGNKHSYNTGCKLAPITTSSVREQRKDTPHRCNKTALNGKRFLDTANNA